MQVRPPLWLMVLLAAVAACSGGSGSSGFDVLSENAAITQALAHPQQCVERQGLMICAAGEAPAVTPTPTPSGTSPGNAVTATPTPHSIATATPTGPSATPTPTATPTPSTGKASIDTPVNDAAAIVCAQPAPQAGCSFTLPFTPRGFPADAVYHVAVRVDASGAWTIGGEAFAGQTSPAAGLDAPVAIEPPLRVPAAGVSVQLAVLVFLKPPAAVPASVAELADSGADYAFVTPELTLQPEAAALRQSP